MKLSKPNIIVILTDDQGYGDLGCHGNPILKTPNIDSLHDESFCFTDFHVGPTCAPTRSGLITGRYANSAGVWHTVGGRSLLRRGLPTIGEIFSRGGWRTGLFGKWHLGDAYPYRPQDRGFQEVASHGGGGLTQVPDWWGNDYFDDTYMVNGKPVAFQGYCTDVWFRLALDFISRHRDEPFLCFLTPNAPHSPYNVEPQWSDPYRGLVPTEDRANFYGMIANIDWNIGQLRMHLVTLGLTENTILVFMTDNGSSCTDPGAHTAGLQGFKNSPYDGGHRVPFFLHIPGTPGRDIPVLTAHVDFMPTMCQLAGVQDELWKAVSVDGQSLVPLVTNDPEPWPQRIMVTDSQRLPQPVKWRQSSVMSDRWRLVNGSELYDSQHDRGQEHNIAQNHPQVVVQLRRAYEKWWDKVSAQYTEEIPMVIGSPDCPVAELTAHDWRPFDYTPSDDPNQQEDNGYLVFHQGQVRKGLGTRGYFEVEVCKAGTYRFRLRRWPKECGGSLGGTNAELSRWRKDIIAEKYHPLYEGASALAITHAHVRFGDQLSTTIADPRSPFAELILYLSSGTGHLEAWFTGPDFYRGAYYVEIDQI